MKKFELIVGLIAILGIVLKLLHIPGSGLLTVLTLLTLSMFYYAFSFALFNGIRLRDIFKKASYKDTSVKRIIGAVGLGFALSTIIIGVLFKLQFWPGAMVQLMTGLVMTGLILLIATIFYFRSKADFYKRVFRRIAIYGIPGLMLLLTSTATLVDIYYRDKPEYAALYKEVLADPDNMELRGQLERMEKEMLEQEWQNNLEKSE